MKKVFISYSSKDVDFVRFIAGVLKEHDIECWFSADKLGGLDNWAGIIEENMRTSDYFLVILSKYSIASGQVMNELNRASQLNLTKLPVRLDNTPLPNEISYHLPINAIDYYKMNDDEFFELLLEKMNSHHKKVDILVKEKKSNHDLYDLMSTHTSDLFSEVSDYGGYSWGVNKSVIQNTDGGWFPENIIMEEVDDAMYSFSEEYEKDYRDFYHSPEFQKMIRRGQNQTRWMLTGFGAYQNKLFLSVKRTEWSQTQFSWHRIMNDEQRRTEAIADFFDEEATDFPNSLCLHVVLVDSNNEVVATRIKKRKKNDYPSTIAVTLGEQINESDFSAGLGDKFLIQWLRRALYEEFGFNELEYHKYVSEGTARVMSLDLEGDIFNFALVCCVKLNCSCGELYEYYQLHRSSEDEFDELIPINTSEIMNILAQSEKVAADYHPSSFLRLFYSYVYITGQLPFEDAAT